jgi:hypothetical protein
MREKELLQLWNSQRSQRIASQLGPTILLAATLALTTTGKLTYKSPLDLRAFAIGLVVAGGVFSVSGILASIRDSLALTRALKMVDDISPLGLGISRSQGSLMFSGFLFVILSLFNVAVLALYLFRK